MNTRRTLAILSALIILFLPACQPQVELQPAREEDQEVTAAVPPSSTPSLEAVIKTPILETVTETSVPELLEEIVMPVEATEQPAEPTIEEEVDVERPLLETAVQPVENDWITQAKADLALRQALPLAEIELLSFENKVWPDGSLGCPQPGWNYIQVLTEGYLIRLSSGENIFHYHGGSNRAPFLCKTTGPEKEITRPAPPDSKLTPTKSVPPPRK